MEKCNKRSNSINDDDNDNKNDNNITKFSKSGSKKKRCTANSGGDSNINGDDGLPVVSDATPVLDDGDNPLLLEMIEKHCVAFMAHMYLYGT